MTSTREVRYRELHLKLRSRLINRLSGFIEFIETLEESDIFNARLFRVFRVGTYTQHEWAQLVEVSQGTIGNWERGVTYPNKYYRKKILEASKQVLELERRRVDRISEQLGFSSSIDPVSTRTSLDSSILRASLTDFEYDEASGRIISIPFAKDDRFDDNSDLSADKKDLLNSLSEQCALIVSGLSRGVNAETDRLCEYFEKYQQYATSHPPNPRLLHRVGDTIAKRTASDDVRLAVNDWDDAAIDGFNSDHLELMRLYYREALAKAQVVEAAELDADLSGEEHHAFYKVADLIEQAVNDGGVKLYDEDIPTLLRDIGKEIRDIGEAETFSFDEKRKAALRRRRNEAIKNGSIFVGRILFFSSLFVVMSPAALATTGSVASILGLVETMAPGSVLSVYETLRRAFPILPKLRK